MTSAYSFLCRLFAIAFVITFTHLHAQEDPGAAKIGTLDVTVYYATNADPSAAGERAGNISEATKTSLSAIEGLRFTHYRAMGADSKPIFKSYENWVQPLKPSDEILIRFETRLEPSENEMPLNLDLWLSRKKVLKSDITLKSGQPLYVLGPEWRGGRLIIAVELAPKKP
ncbi:MAG: hypothetical protein V4727_01630 [Verrucomicrobiota bacterium]